MLLIRVLTGLFLAAVVRMLLPAASGPTGPTGSGQPDASDPTPGLTPTPADAASPPAPDRDAEAPPAPGAAGAAAASARATRPERGRPGPPALLRAAMALLPIVGVIGLVGSLAVIIAGSAGVALPGLGVVSGDGPLGVVLLSVALLAIWVLWQVPRWQAAGWRHDANLTDRELFDLENSARGTLGQILSGVAVLAGLIFAWQQLGNTSQSLFVSQQGQITDRFSRAVEQLGSDDLTIRLGGIYALERIARDSAPDHETVLEVLSAFVRQQSQADVAASAAMAAGTPLVAGESGVTAMPVSGLRQLPLDIDTVLKVISRRDPTRDGPDCINLAGIDLTGGQLAAYNLHHVCFAGANLSGTNLTGANLAGVDLTNVNFRGANLDHADLSGALLSSATFTAANLSAANLSGTDLTNANLAGVPLVGTNLQGARLNGTNLQGALLSGADLTGANLFGADLTGAIISGTSFANVSNLTPEQVGSMIIIDDTSVFPPGMVATPTP